MDCVYELLATKTKKERQTHLDLSSPCLERGGTSTNHKGVLAHFLNTTIPSGKKAPLCHACHNGKCSNPQHLYWGTPSENRIDSRESGTRKSMKGIVRIPHTEESKLKISLTTKGKQSNNHIGKNGSATGNIQRGYKRNYKQRWINNGETNTRIKADLPLPDGWIYGRIIA